MSRPLAIIPVRHGARRFPGKPLTPILGRPMVLHVVDRCREAGCFESILVATDDERIRAVVESHGTGVVMTSPACPSGTDRVADAARALSLPDDAVVVNVQGDEPAVHPESLRTLCRTFEDPRIRLATLVRPLSVHERNNPHVVKVVLDEEHTALYFSRADLPYVRDGDGPAPPRWAHVGLYGYRWSVLDALSELPATALEHAEGLEQLRALGHGIRIVCRVTPHRSVAVDTLEDVAWAEEAVRRLGPRG